MPVLASDIVRLSQVCQEWRQVIIASGEIQKHIKQLEEFEPKEKSIDALKKDFAVIDDIFLYCYMVDKSGVVYGWGDNSHYQLTDQLNDEVHPTPQELTKFGDVTSLFTSYKRSFVLKGTELFGVGLEKYEEYEESDYDEVVDEPVLVPVPKRVILPPVNFKSMADYYLIDTHDRLWSWVNFDEDREIEETMNLAELFDESHEADFFDIEVPKLDERMKEFKVKQAPENGDCLYSCFLTTDGEVFMSEADEDLVQVDVEKISQISCGSNHCLFLAADSKTVWALGENECEQLGQSMNLPESLTPMRVPFLTDKKIIKVQAASKCSAVLTADGKVIVWGIWFTTRDHDRRINDCIKCVRNALNAVISRSCQRSLPVVPRIIDIKQQVVDISLCDEVLLALTIG